MNLIQSFDRYYSSEHVYQEAVAIAGKKQAHLEGVLTWTPVVPKTLVLTIKGKRGKMRLEDTDGNGELHGDAGGRCTVDYQSGQVSVVLAKNAAPGAQLLADYCMNMLAVGVEPMGKETGERGPAAVACGYCGRAYLPNVNGCPGCGAPGELP